jgi:hypothetical protein
VRAIGSRIVRSRRAAMRSRSSAAARRLNVRTSAWSGVISPDSTRCTTASTIVVVLPVPGPASTRTGPPRCSIARRCASSRTGGTTSRAGARTTRGTSAGRRGRRPPAVPLVNDTSASHHETLTSRRGLLHRQPPSSARPRLRRVHASAPHKCRFVARRTCICEESRCALDGCAPPQIAVPDSEPGGNGKPLRRERRRKTHTPTSIGPKTAIPDSPRTRRASKLWYSGRVTVV